VGGVRSQRGERVLEWASWDDRNRHTISMPARVNPILLLHGQPGNARDWDAVIASIGTGANVLAVDRPGWDGSSAPGGFERSAEAALAALDLAQADSATVVGYSYGAGVAAWIAARHPERVERLVLVSPAANTASLTLVDRLLALPLVGHAASVALGSLRSPRTARSFYVEQRSLIRDLSALEAALHRISAPTTIVIGTSDTVVPPRSARLLAAQIGSSELIDVPGGHHLLIAEIPARLAEIILRPVEAQAVNSSRARDRNSAAAGP
jgi:pimeloyl-ACP methyl ester carboxylesterase